MTSDWTFTQINRLHTRLNEHSEGINRINRAVLEIGDLEEPTTTTHINARIGNTIDSIHRSFGRNVAASVDSNIGYYNRLGAPTHDIKIGPLLERANVEFDKREHELGSKMSGVPHETITQSYDYLRHQLAELEWRMGTLAARSCYEEVLKDQFIADLYKRTNSQSTRLDRIDGSSTNQAVFQRYQRSIDKARAEALLLNSPTANQVLADFALANPGPRQDGSTSAAHSAETLTKVAGDGDAALLSLLMRMAHGFDQRVGRLESELQMGDGSVAEDAPSNRAVQLALEGPDVASSSNARPRTLTRAALAAALSSIMSRGTVTEAPATLETSMSQMTLDGGTSVQRTKVARVQDVERVVSPISQGISELRGSVALVQENQASFSRLDHDIKVAGGAIHNLRKELGRMSSDVQQSQIASKVSEAQLQKIVGKVDAIDQTNKSTAATAQQIMTRLDGVESSLERFDARLRALETQ